MARTPLMAGNWKMNMDHLEAIHLVQGLALDLQDNKFEKGTVDVWSFRRLLTFAPFRL